MERKLPRYRVSRTITGWAVVDTSKAKTRPHNDVVERFGSRTPARLKCRQLNLADIAATQQGSMDL